MSNQPTKQGYRRSSKLTTRLWDKDGNFFWIMRIITEWVIYRMRWHKNRSVVTLDSTNQKVTRVSGLVRKT